jgi:predicted amidohydrolase
MRISLLQPAIVRGDIESNLQKVTWLINKAQGQLLILPEYAFTGSLVVEKNADVHDWTLRSKKAISQIRVPNGKHILINTLQEIEGNLRNCCTLLPESQTQFKLFPDDTELGFGIRAGMIQEVFEIVDVKFKVVICSDIRQMEKITTDGLNFLVFVYHFTEENFSRVIELVKATSTERNLPIFASSLVSDKNNGFSSYVRGRTVVSLSNEEGILEIEF